MNKAEKIAKKRLEQLGFIVLHKGCPDFLVYKKDKFGKISDVRFVEVKTHNLRTGYEDKLTNEQKIWKNCIKNFLKLDYNVLIINVNEYLSTSKLYCEKCNAEIEYIGIGRKPKYCMVCKRKEDINSARINNLRKKLSKKIGKKYKALSDNKFPTNNEAKLSKNLPYKKNYLCKCNCKKRNVKNEVIDYTRGEIYCKRCGVIIGEILIQ